MGNTYTGGVMGMLILVLSIIAAVLTQNIWVGLGMFALGMVLNIIAFISIIPIIGLIAQYFIASWLLGKLIVLLTIPASVLWIANGMFWLSISAGLVVTLIIVIAIAEYKK